MKAIICIYKIQSKIIPKRCYIGSTLNFTQRRGLHLKELKLNKHHSRKLQLHYNKYGKSDLQFSILISCNKEDLIKQEQFFIDIYNPYFNISKTAGSPLGCKHTTESRQRQSARTMGIHISERTEFKKGQLSWNTGKQLSPEIKKKISDSWNKDREKRGNNISKARKGKSNGHEGLHHSQESITRMSLRKKGKKMSEEARKNMSIGKIGNKNSLGRKWNDKMREIIMSKLIGNKYRLGKYHSIESRNKMSLSQKERCLRDKLKREQLKILGNELKK